MGGPSRRPKSGAEPGNGASDEISGSGEVAVPRHCPRLSCPLLAPVREGAKMREERRDLDAYGQSECRRTGNGTLGRTLLPHDGTALFRRSSWGCSLDLFRHQFPAPKRLAFFRGDSGMPAGEMRNRAAGNRANVVAAAGYSRGMRQAKETLRCSAQQGHERGPSRRDLVARMGPRAGLELLTGPDGA